MNTYLAIILGGIFLGSSAGAYLIVRGRITGCSGMVYRCTELSLKNIDLDSRLFVVGLFLSGVIFYTLYPVMNPIAVFKVNYINFFLGGILVGLGTYISSGCTSGHGLCGLSLLRKRSIVAVSLFFPSAVITAWVVH